MSTSFPRDCPTGGGLRKRTNTVCASRSVRSSVHRNAICMSSHMSALKEIEDRPAAVWERAEAVVASWCRWAGHSARLVAGIARVLASQGVWWMKTARCATAWGDAESRRLSRCNRRLRKRRWDHVIQRAADACGEQPRQFIAQNHGGSARWVGGCVHLAGVATLEHACFPMCLLLCENLPASVEGAMRMRISGPQMFCGGGPTPSHEDRLRAQANK